MQKRMFKVITPIERRDGTKFWMRLGSGFTNKDDSINVYLDAVPLGKDLTLQLRELTDEDLKERETRRAAFASRTASNPNPNGAATGAADLPF